MQEKMIHIHYVRLVDDCSPSRLQRVTDMQIQRQLVSYSKAYTQCRVRKYSERADGNTMLQIEER